MQPFARFVEREPVSDESCEKQSAALGYQRGRGQTRFLLKNQGHLVQELVWNAFNRFGIFGERTFQARLSAQQRASASLRQYSFFKQEGERLVSRFAGSLLRILAPHSGHSSQLFSEVDERN